MLKIGRTQKLKIGRAVDFGLYLTDGEEEVLLPNKYIPIGSKIGDEIDVFVYTDSEDRPVATTLIPYGEVGDLVALEVKSVSKFGAFLDVGLEKDLLIPFKEQHRKLNEGEKVLVKILLDHRTGRMIGVSKVIPFLNKDTSKLKEGEQVDVLIWTKSDLGFSVIINSEHQGLLYANEIFENIKLGDQRKGYIKKVREDGKVDVSIQPQGFAAVKDMSSIIMDKLEESEGVLEVGDKSDPELIKSMFGMSKKNFKKVVGGLYKAGKITITDQQIRIKD